LEAKLKLGLLAAAAVAALYLTAPAGAHIVRRGCNSKLPARAELACARVNRQHALATIMWARRTERRLSLLDASTALILGRVVANHRWLYRTMTARVAEAERRIAAAALPAHYALWNCIHAGAYPGAPHEGWSASGRYTGPLQMTSTWMGHALPWASMSYVDVYRVAEQEYAHRGYSTAWLEHQWPETSPPCLRFAGT
jgi:hypothetical protein